MKHNIATYKTAPAKGGRGTYYYTTCGHLLYSVKGPEAYHGCICPACWRLKNRETVLYMEENNG